MNPNGATHKHECYGDITYWKICETGLNYVGDGYPETERSWFYWSGNKWIKDNPCTRHFVEL